MRIYTRTGDDGTTSLWRENGQPRRVPKHDARVEAYGTVDEANSVIGVAKAFLDPKEVRVRDWLTRIQQDLFDVGSDLATPDIGGEHVRTAATDTKRLENWIDEEDRGLERLRTFILPDGCPAGALLHQSRTVVRRAERAVTRLLAESDSTAPLELRETARYLNRLSDLLFTLARAVNARAGVPETAVDRRNGASGTESDGSRSEGL